MRCPGCQTDNRDDRETCYHCGKDLAMLRLLVNKAKAHFNEAVDCAAENRFHDALGELNSAIELDAGFVEARVLKGTILAKLERFAESRVSLEEALATHPRLARAHRHLNEVRDVQAAMPLVVRLRKLALWGGGSIAAVLAVLLVAGGSWGWRLAREQRALGALGEGWQALAAGEYGAARDAARRAPESAAEVLLAAIDASVSARVRHIDELAARGAYREALTAAQELRRLDLTESQLALVARAESAIAESLLAGLRAGYASASHDAGGIEALERNAKTFEELFPSRKGELAQLRAEWRLRAASRLDAALAAYDAEAAGAPVESLAVTLRGLEPLAAALGRTGDLAARQAALQERALSGLRAEFAAAARGRESGAVLELADDLTALGAELDDVERAAIVRARRQIAIDAYYALMEQGADFDAGTLTGDQARGALALIARARGGLPPALAERAQRHLLFFEAVARRTLGESGRAEACIRELSEAHPESPYLLAWEKLKGGTG